MVRLTTKNDDYAYIFCDGVHCKFFGEPNGCNSPGGPCESFEIFTTYAEELRERENAEERAWISVKDGLPERSGSYIVCTEKNAVCTAHYDTKWNSWHGKTVPTHWMPLPEAPADQDLNIDK